VGLAAEAQRRQARRVARRSRRRRHVAATVPAAQLLLARRQAQPAVDQLLHVLDGAVVGHLHEKTMPRETLSAFFDMATEGLRLETRKTL